MITNDINLPNRSAGNNRHIISPVERNILNVAPLPVPPAAGGWLLIKLVSCSFILLHGLVSLPAVPPLKLPKLQNIPG